MQQNFGNDQKLQDAVNTLEAQAGVKGNDAQAGQAKYDADYAARMAGAYAQNPVNEEAQASAQAPAQDAASATPAAQSVRDPHAAAATAAYTQTQSYGSESKAAFNANGNPQDGDKNVANSSDPNFAELKEQYQQQGQSLQEDEPDVDDDIDLDEEVDTEELEAELSQLRGQMEIIKKSYAAEHDKMLRAVAEVENIRKRTEQEIDRERKFALERFVRSLLPIYDALEQAMKFSDPNNEATKGTYDGVKQTLDLFLKEMSNFGVEVIDPTGKPFDPNFHQAISMFPDPNVPNGHVSSTMQKGFTLNGRVVRPAMVVVSKS